MRLAWTCLPLAGCLLAWPALARADAPSADRAVHVRIVQIGHADEWGRLERVLVEFLAPHGLTPQFESRSSLSHIEALEPGQEPAQAVWIELVSAERARLVLGDAAGGRYLLRDVPLANGLDAVGREALSQVLEASLLALRGGEPALTRAEVQRLLVEPNSAPIPAGDATSADPPTTPEAPVSPAIRRVPQRPVASESSTTPASRVEVSIGYTLRWTGEELGPLHAPGASLGWAKRVAAGSWVGLALTGEQRLAQTYTGALVAFSVQSRAAWLSARAELPVGAVSVLAEAGAGLTWEAVSPRAVAGGLTELAPDSSSTTAGFRLVVAVGRRAGTWLLRADVGVDISAHDTHYDVVQAGLRQRLVTPSVVRPGLGLGVGFGG